MAKLTVEFYEDERLTTNNSQPAYGRLISSSEDTSLSTTVEHVTVPGNSQYARVVTDTDVYVEIGNGNQDCGSTRRTWLPSDIKTMDFVVRGTDTLSYRSVV